MNKAEPIIKDGWVVLDKPEGITSARAVAIVKRLLNAKKAGHAGTLDPLASGVLPIAIGEATKTIQLITDTEKSYLFTVEFGSETDTDDKEGKIIKTSDVIPSKEDIINALPYFTGEIEQTPPTYSAIKVNGKRAYKLARQGLIPELKSRKITIYKAKLVSMPEKDSAEFEITCSKGTYVRSFARDIARKMGAFGHISALRRQKVGIFSEKSAILLESLEKLVQSAAPHRNLSQWVLPVETVLDDIPVLNLNQSFSKALRNGQSIILPEKPLKNATVCALNKGKLVAIGRVEGDRLKPVRVFNH